MKSLEHLVGMAKSISGALGGVVGGPASSYRLPNILIVNAAFENFRASYIRVNKHILLDGPAFKEDEKGNIYSYDADNNKWNLMEKLSHPYDQGAVIHGEELRRYAVEANCKTMFQIAKMIDPECLKRVSYVSRDRITNEALMVRHDEKYNLHKMTEERRVELLGPKLEVEFKKYDDLLKSKTREELLR